MGKSLTFSAAVFETQDLLKTHRCKDPVCRLRHRRLNLQLESLRFRIRQLEDWLSEADTNKYVQLQQIDYPIKLYRIKDRINQ